MRPSLAPVALVVLAAACSSGSGIGSPAGATATTCTYPAGPYGTGIGDVVDPSLTWQGYVDQGTQAQTIGVRDFYDCNGSLGVRALLLDESATWCADCANQEVALAPLQGGQWRTDGVHVVTLMAQDQQTNPATLDTALSWRNEYALTTGAVCADPKWTLKLWGGATGSGNGFPTDVVVDPRTMKIVDIQPLDVKGTIANLVSANR